MIKKVLLYELLGSSFYTVSILAEETLLCTIGRTLVSVLFVKNAQGKVQNGNNKETSEDVTEGC